MNKFFAMILASAALTAVPALAQEPAEHDARHQAASADAGNSAALTEGEVRKVDKEAKKLTIRHGALENLGMPAMTMVFQVKDPAMLDQVSAGDKIRFAADKPGGSFTVVQLQRVN